MERRGLRHMPALDGLRALAVIAVLLYHGDVSWARGGYFGVDAFFVLSGFLITSLLLHEWNATGRIDLKAFWGRRARRLLPALALVLGAVALYAAYAASPIELGQLRRDGFAALAYVANWNQIFSHEGYFQQFAAPSALKHMWSLAIEEQFYLIWPLVVFGLLRARRGSRNLLLGVAVTAAAGSAILMAVLYHPGADPSRVYYGTDTRAQSLLIGTILAMLLVHRADVPSARPRVRNGAGLAAAFALAIIWTTTNETQDWQYRGGFVIAAVLVSVVIWSVTRAGDTGPLGRALSWKPLSAVGAVSYGLYLFHWPIYVYLDEQRTGLSHLPLLLLRLTVTSVVATASFVLLERPVRRGVFTGWSLRVGAPAVAGVVALALFASTAGVLPAQFQAVSASAIAPPPVAPPVEPLRGKHTKTKPPLKVMLVGDSVAASLSPGLTSLARDKKFLFWNVAVPGCGVSSDAGEHYYRMWLGIDPRCVPPWHERWAKQTALFKPDVVLMLVGAQDTFDRRVNGNVFRFDTQAGQALAAQDLTDAVKMLSAKGAHVILLKTPYYMLGWPMPITTSRSCFDDAWIDTYNTIQTQVTKDAHGHASILDLNRLLDPDGHWTDTVNGIRTRSSDKVHLSWQGALFAANFIAPALKRYPQPGHLTARPRVTAHTVSTHTGSARS